MKIATIVGARPQFVKAAVVSRPLRRLAREVLVHTGQHYDANMSDVFFAELEIPSPDYHLAVGSAPHGEQTGEMLKQIERVLLAEKPDSVLVYGDTNSTLAGALAAAKLHIPVAHVEAGLRSFNRRMPEEVNRVVTDHLSSLLFAPTDAAVFNLEREGLTAGVCHVGDVMYDAALHYLEQARKRSKVLERCQLRPGEYVLATLHRAENTDEPGRLRSIMSAFIEVSREAPVVFPVHPRTRRLIDALPQVPGGSLLMIEPVSYFDMLQLESSARCIVTDSGGVQKEAFFFRVPCVTTRDESEWVETLETSWNTLAGADAARIVSAVRKASPGSSGAWPYGRGNSAQQIVHVLTSGALPPLDILARTSGPFHERVMVRPRTSSVTTHPDNPLS
ncbi:MAG TPA: UDP-N-acetylglucosamine 2-epimerase (non-hydrolyzing) [Terriglobia bacterium]|nr:UDP-N-acetylglucosamine 2-epimerase (non-hydrolyzing) [Terriglobia bacterium]